MQKSLRKHLGEHQKARGKQGTQFGQRVLWAVFDWFSQVRVGGAEADSNPRSRTGARACVRACMCVCFSWFPAQSSTNHLLIMVAVL